jgi:hypothetical protein
MSENDTSGFITGDPQSTMAGLNEGESGLIVDDIEGSEESSTFDRYYQMAFNAETNVLTVSFGKTPTTKDRLVSIAKSQIDGLLPDIINAQVRSRYKILKLTGAATNMVTAVVIAALFNKVKAIAMYDPDQSAYVIVLNKDGQYTIGSVLQDD